MVRPLSAPLVVGLIGSLTNAVQVGRARFLSGHCLVLSLSTPTSTATHIVWVPNRQLLLGKCPPSCCSSIVALLDCGVELEPVLSALSF